MDLNLQTSSLKRNKITTKIIALILTAALVLSGVTPSFAAKKTEEIVPSADISWDDAPKLSATSAILMDAGSGDILYEKNGDERRDPASITKILTCLVALETLDLKTVVTVDYESIETVGHVLELKQGEKITVEDLLYGMMVYSANDAAQILAIESGGTIENFCKMMNNRAKECGAVSTNFTNPNGLNTYGQENHRTTAYDIALITKEAMKNKTFRKLVKTVDYTIPKTNKSKARKLKSTNLCLYAEKKMVEINDEKRPFKYEGTIGVKTGSTGTAGECFCGMAKKNGTVLIAISLNAATPEERFSDVIQLWDYGFSKYYTYNAAKGRTMLEEIKVKRGEKAEVEAGLAEDLDITLNAGYDSKNIKTKIKKDIRKLEAPVKTGQVVGTVEVYKEGKLVASEDLITLEASKKGGFLSYVGIADEEIPGFFLTIIIIIAAAIGGRMLYVKHRRIKRKQRKAQRERNIRRREWDKEKNPFDK